MQHLARLRDARSGRVSSWDQSGRNQDYWLVPAGEEMVLADIAGPGTLTHIWMTQFCRRVAPFNQAEGAGAGDAAPRMRGWNWETVDPFYYRKVLVKIYWDDQAHPSVLAPLGDLFCIGHSIPGNFAALPITVSTTPADRYTFGANAALNCYFPMPFNERARVVIENQNDVPFGQYFYLDYELYREPLGDDVVYFHAHWRRENPTDGWGSHLLPNTPETNIAHLEETGNYVILETEGQGHYVGCNLSVAHFQASWWGEGDEMIFIDDDTWPPSLHGTGSEDYFNHAWGMQDNQFPMNGSALHESVLPGYQTSYRFHLLDPVHFARRIRVTMEHGHANHLASDWSSTAYWYQTLPSPVLDILPVEARLPLVLGSAPGVPRTSTAAPAAVLNEEMREGLAQAEERYREYLAQREREMAQDVARSRRSEQRNIEQARRLRESFGRQRPRD